MIDHGNELIIGKETVTGASTIKLQLESTKSRWESIELHSLNRQQSLEDALETTFKDNVNEITFWLQEREKQIDDHEFMMHLEDSDAFVLVCFLTVFSTSLSFQNLVTDMGSCNSRY